MIPISHPVIDGLRRTLTHSRSASPFIQELGERVHQLVADMVDGRVLPKGEAEALRAGLIELVRLEALPRIGAKNPNDALRVLDKLKAYGFAQLEEERPRLERERASKFPPPPPVDWPEIDELRSAAERHPNACTVGLPVQNVYFAAELKEDGLALPDELLGLYAAYDGFDLSCIAATYLPVFSLLSARSIDTCDAENGYPRRAAVFAGGDENFLSVYRDRKKQWWLVHEHEYVPVAKKLFDLRELVRFGLKRMRAPTEDALLEDLSWERFFK